MNHYLITQKRYKRYKRLLEGEKRLMYRNVSFLINRIYRNEYADNSVLHLLTKYLDQI